MPQILVLFENVWKCDAFFNIFEFMFYFLKIFDWATRQDGTKDRVLVFYQLANRYVSTTQAQ